MGQGPESLTSCSWPLSHHDEWGSYPMPTNAFLERVLVCLGQTQITLRKVEVTCHQTVPLLLNSRKGHIRAPGSFRHSGQSRISGDRGAFMSLTVDEKELIISEGMGNSRNHGKVGLWLCGICHCRFCVSLSSSSAAPSLGSVPHRIHWLLAQRLSTLAAGNGHLKSASKKNRAS